MHGVTALLRGLCLSTSLREQGIRRSNLRVPTIKPNAVGFDGVPTDGRAARRFVVPGPASGSNPRRPHFGPASGPATPAARATDRSSSSRGKTPRPDHSKLTRSASFSAVLRRVFECSELPHHAALPKNESRGSTRRRGVDARSEPVLYLVRYPGRRVNPAVRTTRRGESDGTRTRGGLCRTREVQDQ